MDPEKISVIEKPHANSVLSLVTDKKHVSESELALLKIQLQTFAAALGEKVAGAEPATKRVFNPMQLLIEDIITSSALTVSPEDDAYRKLEKIVQIISMNPVTAFTFEESLRSELGVLATIQPEKGPGATYREGEKLRFAVKADRDCYVQIFFVSMQENGRNSPMLQPLMFSPSPGKSTIQLRSGDSLILGEDGSFVVEPPYGNDMILVVASHHPLRELAASDTYPFTFPMHPGRLLAGIYGEQQTRKLSIHSCFIVSKPTEKNRSGSNIGLLTEEEAKSLRLDEFEWARPPLMYRAVQAGPLIKVHLPSLTGSDNPTISATTPLDLKISFESKDAPVDMNTLEVLAKKGFFSKSITERVKEHIHGTVLEAKNLDFPRGKFRIQVEIADVHGIVTVQEYRLEVH